jgi:hypothetical protein
MLFAYKYDDHRFLTQSYGLLVKWVINNNNNTTMKLALNETQFHKTVLGEFFHKKAILGAFLFPKNFRSCQENVFLL